MMMMMNDDDVGKSKECVVITFRKDIFCIYSAK
jgi:hypothetical protein